MAASHIPSILIVDDIGANLRLLYDILVSEVLAGLDDMIKSSHAKITIEELPVLYGCETELKLLFSNLVVNAIKFRRKNILPEIKITAESCEKKWAFKISDNGIGIEKKNREKIFIIFKRMHNRSEYKGTGIGLSHCKKIVELHGGKIWVESSPGAGSIFIFTITKS
jgi:light-regulated signal transduction histidine kinase (bacteriophytochrome)